MSNPPAIVKWTNQQGLYLAKHNETLWALVTHSAHRGKAGWSGTDEWHLHRAYPATGEVGWVVGSVPLDHGRWLARPGRCGFEKAKRLAAWIIANPTEADCMAHHEIVRVVEASEDQASLSQVLEAVEEEQPDGH